MSGGGAEALFRNEEYTFEQNVSKAETPYQQQSAGSKGNFPSPNTPAAGIEEEKEKSLVYFSRGSFACLVKD